MLANIPEAAMDTAFLKSFLLTVETGSMSEAARRLDVTPAAVAQQVRALERHLGTRLLQRAGRTVKPTQTGHLLCTNAKPLIQGIDNLRYVINTDPMTGELRLGSINTALLSFLPQTLKTFSTRYPDIRISIRSGHSHELIRLLESDEIDAAICIHPNFNFSKSLRWETFRHESLVILAPLASSSNSPSELLQQYPLIRYDRSLGGGKQADLFLHDQRIKPIECVELSSIQAIALMVESGLGVSIVPDINSKIVNGLAIRKIELQCDTVQRSIGILSRQHAFKAPLIDHLTSCYRSLDPALR